MIMGGNLSYLFLLLSYSLEKCFQGRYENVHYCYLREWRKGACSRAGGSGGGEVNQDRKDVHSLSSSSLVGHKS